jgi:transcriptional regulator with XRE-family HTH domain
MLDRTSLLTSSRQVARQVGQAARRRREEQDLRLAHVAKQAGISAAMLSRLENGAATLSLSTPAALSECPWGIAIRIIPRFEYGGPKAATRQSRPRA